MSDSVCPQRDREPSAWAAAVMLELHGVCVVALTLAPGVLCQAMPRWMSAFGHEMTLAVSQHFMAWMNGVAVSQRSCRLCG